MKKLIILSLAAVLAGCATSYQPMRSSGGYDETRVSSNIWTIRGKANGYSERSRLEDITLLRAAEIGCLNSYQYFDITDRMFSGQNIKNMTITAQYSHQAGDYDVRLLINTLSKKLSADVSCR